MAKRRQPRAITDGPPYLHQVVLRDPDFQIGDAFPFNLPWLTQLPIAFDGPVTFLVGENGSGKSTLIEAIADLSDLPVSGGGRNEAQSNHGPEDRSMLSSSLLPSFTQKPTDGFFLRAEFGAHFASLLDERAADPEFGRIAYERYGGRSLHTRSHGEAFLEILQSQINSGLILMDEPESALSPQRQLVLLALMHDRARSGLSQFIIATHSPILLTYPNATIYSFDDGRLEKTTLEDTAHYQITRGILEQPERYWRHLREDSQHDDT
ncbi:AAA family ATPase [Algisphaera agarilytica]|uniref:Putative ATPase n=1 Tax=Algisphaera agarilytica TaxID=1385975 RepID=A0A7X0H823_9BACT|nr:AAA family ATPase [Algisphaera agarilytica]MBB6430984.1 putative ATPase [Algisphaera agarilytica]